MFKKYLSLLFILSGRVLAIASIPEQLHVDIIVVATQKECEKGSASPGITTAFQRNWKIISPQFLDANTNEAPDAITYLLKLDYQKHYHHYQEHHQFTTVANSNFRQSGAFSDLKKRLHWQQKV